MRRGIIACRGLCDEAHFHRNARSLKRVEHSADAAIRDILVEPGQLNFLLSMPRSQAGEQVFVSQTLAVDRNYALASRINSDRDRDWRRRARATG